METVHIPRAILLDRWFSWVWTVGGVLKLSSLVCRGYSYHRQNRNSSYKELGRAGSQLRVVP